MKGKWQKPRRGPEVLQQVEEERERGGGEAEAVAEPLSVSRKETPGLK